VSTKVYVAYKIRPEVARDQKRFWAWVRRVHRKGEENIRGVLRTMYEVHGRDEVRKGYRDQSTKSERNEFDLDVSIAIRELDGGLYIIPRCDMMMGRVLDFLKRDPALQDFAYWNNTDPPRGMRSGAGYARWEERGKVWEALDVHWQEFLVLELMTVSKFSYVEPWFYDLMEKQKLAREKRDPHHGRGGKKKAVGRS
jgi:hypothetical protein